SDTEVSCASDISSPHPNPLLEGEGTLAEIFASRQETQRERKISANADAQPLRLSRRSRFWSFVDSLCQGGGKGGGYSGAAHWYMLRGARLMKVTSLRRDRRCSTAAATRLARPAMRVGPRPRAARASATVSSGSMRVADRRPERGLLARKAGVRVAPGQKA